MSQSIDLRAEPRRHLAWGLLGALALSGLAACKQDAGSAPSPQVPQVEVITASTTTVPDEPEFIGQAEASRPVEIRSQVTGLIKAVLYQASIRSIQSPSKPRQPVRRPGLRKRKRRSCKPGRIWRG